MAEVPFSYCLLRHVPDLARGERVNVGVVLFCRQRRFLGLEVCADPARLALLADPGPGALESIAEHLGALAAVARGDAGAGPVAALDQSERFGWLAAPSSTVIQPSVVHTGLCEDPAVTLAGLYRRLVAAGGSMNL